MHRDRNIVDSLLRTDFLSFVRRCFQTLNPGISLDDNWHHAAIDYQLSRILRGDINRLIINLPPRYLKSLIVSVAFPAYLLGQKPWRRIFCISYGGELADKHSADFRSMWRALGIGVRSRRCGSGAAWRMRSQRRSAASASRPPLWVL